MKKEEKEFDLRNYEHYKYYYQDASKEEIIQDTWFDYCAYKNMIEKNTELQTQLDQANKKLDKIRKYLGSNEFFEGTHFDTNYDDDIVKFNEEVDRVIKKVLSIIGGNNE